jgi:hypothetical protein
MSSKARTHVCARPGCGNLAHARFRYCSPACFQSLNKLPPEQRIANQRESHRRLRARRRELGQCGSCGTPIQKFTQCLACRLRRKVRRHRQRQQEAA